MLFGVLTRPAVGFRFGGTVQVHQSIATGIGSEFKGNIGPVDAADVVDELCYDISPTTGKDFPPR